jgi:hypothetical protein
MDLLDSISNEAGDEAQAHQSGLFKPGRGKAPSLLLAGVPSSLRSASEEVQGLPPDLAPPGAGIERFHLERELSPSRSVWTLDETLYRFGSARR